MDGVDNVKVELPDDRTFTAKVVGTDPATDLAVVKIDAKSLPTLVFGDSDAVKVGDVALAIGNPLSVGQTVTSGIISAKGRQTPDGGDGYQDFLQTDAAINHGNSGGALVNAGGELIGINSQILSPSDGNIGLGFAIPSNMAKQRDGSADSSGTVRRAKLGVSIQPITPDMASALGLSSTRGALVSNVEDGSPAAKAGLKQGDVITQLQRQGRWRTTTSSGTPSPPTSAGHDGADADAAQRQERNAPGDRGRARAGKDAARASASAAERRRGYVTAMTLESVARKGLVVASWIRPASRRRAACGRGT